MAEDKGGVKVEGTSIAEQIALLKLEVKRVTDAGEYGELAALAERLRALEEQSKASRSPEARWRAANERLQADTMGLGYRRSKDMQDRDPDRILKWDDSVLGTPTGDGWLQVDKVSFLPIEVGGVPVLVKLEAKESLAQKSSVPELGEAEQAKDGGKVEAKESSVQEAIAPEPPRAEEPTKVDSDPKTTTADGDAMAVDEGAREEDPGGDGAGEAKGGGKGELADKQILETYDATMAGFSAVFRTVRRKGSGKGKGAPPSGASSGAEAVSQSGALTGGLVLSRTPSADFPQGGLVLTRAPSADFPQGLKLVRTSSGDLPGPKKAKRWQSKSKLNLEADGVGTPTASADSNGRPEAAARLLSAASTESLGAPSSVPAVAANSVGRPVPSAAVPAYMVLLKDWQARHSGEDVPSYMELELQWSQSRAQAAPASEAPALANGNASDSKAADAPAPDGKAEEKSEEKKEEKEEEKVKAPTSLYGLVFIPKEGEGCASYHFDSEEHDDCYISYAKPKPHWKQANGSRPPERMPFKECSYDEDTRTFCATVHWEPAFMGDSRWEYDMGFAEDFSCIEEGTLITYGVGGEQKKMLNFGMDLHYTRLIEDLGTSKGVLDAKAKANASPDSIPEDAPMDDRPQFPPLRSLTLARLKFLAKYHNISTQGCLDIEDVITKLSAAGISERMAAETPDEEMLAKRAAVRRKQWKPAFSPTPYNHGEETPMPGMGRGGRTPGCKYGHPMMMDTRDAHFRSKRYCDMCRGFGTSYSCSQRPRCDYDMCSKCFQLGGHPVIGP